MSCSLRSRKRSTSPAARIFSTAAGPSWQNSSSPTLTVDTCGATAAVHPTATARSAVSSATAMGARSVVMSGLLEGDDVRRRGCDDRFVAGWVRRLRHGQHGWAMRQPDHVAKPRDAALGKRYAQLT